MTRIKKHLISSWIVVMTLAIFVTAQQPPQASPPPATVTQTPAPALIRPTTTITPQISPPTLSTSTPVATIPRVVSPVITRVEPPQSEPANTVQTTRPAPTPNPSPREPEYVEEKGFKGKVFDIKHRDPSSLARALQHLGSGFKGAKITPIDEFNTLTVRDFPENIAAMEDALKRLDVPQPARPGIDFRIHVLVASNGPAPADDVPTELNEVVTQLKSTFKYKTYNLMFTSTHRSKESGGVSNNGVVEPKLFNISVPPHNQIFFSYSLNRISLDQAPGGTSIQVGDFGFRLRIPLLIGSGSGNVQYENVGFSSPISLREGERVVVGTTTMGDKGLVVVLSAKSIK